MSGHNPIPSALEVTTIGSHQIHIHEIGMTLVHPRVAPERGGRALQHTCHERARATLGRRGTPGWVHRHQHVRPKAADADKVLGGRQSVLQAVYVVVEVACVREG